MQSAIDLTVNIPRSALDAYIAQYIENFMNQRNFSIDSDREGDEKYEEV